MASNIVEGFSISHAAILNGTDDALDVSGELADVYGVRDGALAVDEGNYDNTGDEAVLSSWFWFNHVNITIKSGYIPFATISQLTGSSISSSGTGTGATYELPLWEVESMNQPQRPMLIRVPSKDQDGQPRDLDFVLYKVQFMPIKFEGPTYKTGLVVDYSGRALVAAKDEAGRSLSKRAIGRLISTPSS